MIVVDRKLEDLMQIKPPEVDQDYAREQYGMPFGIDERYPIPLECREELVQGCVKLFREDGRLRVRGSSGDPGSFDGNLNRLLGTDSKEWHVYLPVKERPWLEAVEYGLFVYWCLANGCENVVVDLPYGNIPLFGPETPIARIDVSKKAPGSTPSYNDLASNVLYLFTDHDGTARSHDLDIMGRLEKDLTDDGCPWAMPDDMTLRELTELCGNSIRYSTIYNIEDVESSDGNPNDGCEPMELVTDLPKYWNYRGTWKGPERTIGPSMHSGCRVVKYALYGDCGSSRFLDDEGLTGYVHDRGSMGLCAIVDPNDEVT